MLPSLPVTLCLGDDPTIYHYDYWWDDSCSGCISIYPPLRQDVSARTPVYAVEVGLASNWVHAIASDDTGKVWIGTNRGVSKFDGTAWTTYNTDNSELANSSVYAIAIDEEGNKWFGT